MMTPRFKYFVVYAAMRTGSNFLEANINRFDDLKSYGELFNPYFIGGAKKDSLLGLTMKERNKDPFRLIEAIKKDAGDAMPGFRFFHDHDPRILQATLADADCGKVILIRNPLECYVSRKIAAQTGQWRLTNLKHETTAKIVFDAREFEEYLSDVQDFQQLLLAGLQATGQTAFYINYEDLHTLEVLNGLGKYLGSAHRLEALDTKVKKQNPAALESKVANFAEMKEALGEMDFMNLSRTPDMEPRRGAGVPGYLAGQKTPLLFLPVRGTGKARVQDWLARHEARLQGQIDVGLNQKTLRAWREAHPGFHSLTVVRHPVLRVYFTFCEYILSRKHGAYRDLREAIIRNFQVHIPKKGAEAPGYDLDSHRAAFLAFLKFVKANLSRQTTLRIDPAWASQTAIIRGISNVVLPRHILREDNLAQGLAVIETLCGLESVNLGPPPAEDCPYGLQDIYDAQVESRAREIYAQDYLNFGFGDWSDHDI